MELADKIREASLKLFFERGIKAVSMDDVAKSVGISKRTLYETFESKDALLMTCIDGVMRERMDNLDEMLSKSTSFIELIIHSTYECMGFMQTVTQNFFADLERYNYVFVNESMHQQVEKMRCKIYNLIEDGKAKGFLNAEVDSKLISHIILGQYDKGALRRSADASRCSLSHALQQVSTIFLRGMATEKGMRLIDEHLAALTKKAQTQR